MAGTEREEVSDPCAACTPKVLRGRTVLVTGAAGGLGRGLAVACARRGNRVAVADVKREGLDETARLVSQHTESLGVTFDVRDRNAWRAAVAEIETTLGPVDVLFNNAGVADGTQPGVFDDDAWDWQVEVNLHGIYNGISAVVPGMISRGEGSVINTSSVAGLAPVTSASYSATKAAVVALSECLRAELGPLGVQVCVVCPGAMATDILLNTDLLRHQQSPGSRPRGEALVEHVRETHEILNVHGLDIHTAAARVLAGVEAGHPYVYTDDFIAAQARERSRQILGCMTSQTNAPTESLFVAT